MVQVSLFNSLPLDRTSVWRRYSDLQQAGTHFTADWSIALFYMYISINMCANK